LVCPGGVRVCPGAVVDGLVVVVDGVVVVIGGPGAGDVGRPLIASGRTGGVAGVLRAREGVFARDGGVTAARRDGFGTAPTGPLAAPAVGATVACLLTAAFTRSGSAGGAASRAPSLPKSGRPASGCNPSPPRISTTNQSPRSVVTTR